MRDLLTVLAGVFLLTPVAYTFLRLFEFIGPRRASDAIMVGAFLWYFGVILGVMFLLLAIVLWRPSVRSIPERSGPG